MTTLVRAPAVAGMFYPGKPDDLVQVIGEYLGSSIRVPEIRPKAIIVPHAGYQYSGPVAASAYASLESVADDITRVILIGPAHRLSFSGIATHSAVAFRRRWGRCPLIARRSVIFWN